ncbi:hypothetical protein LO762_25785 [Actinocorallia sp. API 0066]|uniref:hypothetical protein n=1 Tax=Actinocorallia sp. API 0066 TaxID=2896846 RepID=UPI001E285368|nr:hypothetical protein [Actinocorallia sp. API 0066]MCD0452568.1 hypothetical protein [Actinocorallia sp. API 0066]
MGLRFSDEEFAAISAAAAREGLSAPNLLATVALEVAAAEALSGVDRRAVVEELAAVRRYLEVCAAGLAGGGESRVAAMVEEAVVRLAGVLDEVEALLAREEDW